jgi:heme exporter protein C
MASVTIAEKQTAKSSRMGGWDIAQLVLNLATTVSVVALMWAAFMHAKPALNLAGDEQAAQRIFYIHMACNIGALAAFMTSVVGSIVYLVTRNLDWDRVTQASVEIGTVIGMGTIITGAIWSKPTWNTYWTWDPRLTASTITVLIYVAYILFRNGIDNRRTKALFGSIYAMIAFLSIPLTYYSARWFRSIHPIVFDGENAEAQGDFAMGATMGETLTIGAISFSLLFASLLILRWRQLRVEDRIEEIREEIEV